jgi:peptide/nickel transport system ATP-binding protein
MYLGQVVETCETKELFRNPMHPYTKALLSAIPSTDIDCQPKRIALKGEITSPIDPEPICRFAVRCIYDCEDCRHPQKLEEISPGHFVSCCRTKDFVNRAL